MDKNKPMNLKFSKINKIGTMVVLARIFTDISKETSIKLLPLAKLINCDGKLIKYIDLWLKKPDKTYYHFFKGNVPDKKKKKDDPYKKKSPKKGFANSFSHDLNVMDSSVRCTIFSNGKLLISGLSSEKQRKLVLRVLSNIYIDIAQKYDKNKEIFSNDINIQYEKHNMIQHTITIDKDIHKNLMIDNLKLLKYLRKEFPYNYSYYEPKEVRSLEMIDPEQKINYMIFQKGTINVTGINKIEDVDLSIRYMVNFLNNNIHKFTMNDVVLNAIVLIEADKHAPEQKSDEWLKSRHSAVTASELAPIVGMGYKGKKMSTYVKEKVKRIKGENKFTGNIYTRKGEIYELLALHSYAYKINKDPKRKYFIIIKEVGLVKHKENNFIGASADGVVFMLSDKVKGIKYNTDPSVEQLYDWYQKDLIIGVHLIEIKCPWNYHIYDSEKCHGVKCIKIGKDEYVRQEYWCQMQQQCYVWDITMNVMSNNNFIEIESREEYLNLRKSNKNKLSGIILKIWGVDKKTPYLPVAIYPKNTICDISLYTNPNVILDSVIDELYKKFWKDYRLEILTNKIYKIKIIYWIHEHYVYTEVPYDKEWYESKIPEIKKCINCIEQSIKSDDEMKKKLDFIKSKEDPLSDDDELSDNDSNIL